MIDVYQVHSTGRVILIPRCDDCRERIITASRGLLMWRHNAVPSQLFMVHIRCALSWASQHDGIQAWGHGPLALMKDRLGVDPFDDATGPAIVEWLIQRKQEQGGNG